jgi:hypothetical protein
LTDQLPREEVPADFTPAGANLAIRTKSGLVMSSVPLCAYGAFSGTATASPGGDAIAAVSIIRSFRPAIADIQLRHQPIMLASTTLLCLFSIVNGHFSPL